MEQLSRREREEIEKQKSKDAYQKVTSLTIKLLNSELNNDFFQLHAEGKTDQAKADLARLAIIKQQRAEAAARREAEKKGKQELPKEIFYKGINFFHYYRERSQTTKTGKII